MPDANPANSICPAGWRLTKVTEYTSGALGDDDIYNLLYYYNNRRVDTDIDVVAGSLYFVRSGNITGAGLRFAGFVGDYWSSTVSSYLWSYYFTLHSTYADPASTGSRAVLRSVRCVAR